MISNSNNKKATFRILEVGRKQHLLLRNMLIKGFKSKSRDHFVKCSG